MLFFVVAVVVVVVFVFEAILKRVQMSATNKKQKEHKGSTVFLADNFKFKVSIS